MGPCKISWTTPLLTEIDNRSNHSDPHFKRTPENCPKNGNDLEVGPNLKLAILPFWKKLTLIAFPQPAHFFKKPTEEWKKATEFPKSSKKHNWYSTLFRFENWQLSFSKSIFSQKTISVKNRFHSASTLKDKIHAYPVLENKSLFYKQTSHGWPSTHSLIEQTHTFLQVRSRVENENNWRSFS